MFSPLFRRTNFLLVVLFLLTAVFLFIAVSFYVRLFAISWRYPVLWMDSYGALILPENQDFLHIAKWLFQPHNEHLIIFTRLFSLLSEFFFDRPPGSFGVPINCSLLFLSAFFAYFLIRSIGFVFLESLVVFNFCALLLANPWQWENSLWEFQTPWFIVPCLLLLNSLLIARATAAGQRRGCQLIVASSIVSPFLFVFSSAQGFAAIISLIVVYYFLDSQLFINCLASSFAAVLAYKLFVTGSTATLHLAFSPLFFAVVLNYSLPILNGLLLNLTAVSFIVLALGNERFRMSQILLFIKRNLPAMLLILYGLIFSVIVTLGRSWGMGDDSWLMALSSRYITNSSILTLGLFLLASSVLGAARRARLVFFCISIFLLLSSSAPRHKHLILPSPYRWAEQYEYNLQLYGKRVAATKCALLSAGAAHCANDGTLYSLDYPSMFQHFKRYYSPGFLRRGWHRDFLARYSITQ